MNSLRQSREEDGAVERLAARFAELWAEQRRLAEKWNGVESSAAWALAQRLANWRRRFAPEGSRRQKLLRFCLRGLRRRRGARQNVPAQSIVEYPAQISLTHRAGIETAPAGKADKIRVAYIGSRYSIDAATMRYRAHNLIEALTQGGMEGTFVSQEEALAQLPAILAHDLIVVVRRVRNDALTAVIGAARRIGLPIVYDTDDYIFDPWILPYVEALHSTLSQTEALHLMDEVGACLDQCDYFTGSTAYLAERAAALGKDSFVIRNGLNTAQLSLSRLAVEQRHLSRSGSHTRIGYFSGTRSHQADFRVAYPALMRLLRERRDVRLAIAGQLDVGAFPGLAPFLDQIDIIPTCHWRELPKAVAGVDINIIPLELTPFNEGKSNLKYYEAGLVEVPSIASPTRILRDSITHGHNGLLAQTPEEWYDGLKELIVRPDWRRNLAKNTFEHVMRNYTPDAVAKEAATVYRQILRLHQTRYSSAKQVLNIVVMVSDPQGAWEEVLRRANELAAAGHTIVVYIPTDDTSTAAVMKAITRRILGPIFAVQRGGDVPRCDILIAADSQAATLAKANEQCAQLTITDAERLGTIQAAGRGLTSLLREWIRNSNCTCSPIQAA